MYKYIFFDLDGTLTDSGEGIINSVIYALSRLGIIETDRKSLFKFIGPPLAESFMKYYGFNEEKAFLAVEYFREYFKENGIYENKLYDFVPELLEKLKKSGKIIVLATSKPEALAKRNLEYFKINDYFSFVFGATYDSTRVKKTDVIKYAINEIENDFKKQSETYENELYKKQLNKKEIIMVGDREHDIIGAKENGIDSLGVSYGYGSVLELENAKANYIVEKVSDILEIVLC